MNVALSIVIILSVIELAWLRYELQHRPTGRRSAGPARDFKVWFKATRAGKALLPYYRRLREVWRAHWQVRDA